MFCVVKGEEFLFGSIMGDLSFCRDVIVRFCDVKVGEEFLLGSEISGLFCDVIMEVEFLLGRSGGRSEFLCDVIVFALGRNF